MHKHIIPHIRVQIRSKGVACCKKHITSKYLINICQKKRKKLMNKIVTKEKDRRTEVKVGLSPLGLPRSALVVNAFDATKERKR